MGSNKTTEAATTATIITTPTTTTINYKKQSKQHVSSSGGGKYERWLKKLQKEHDLQREHDELKKQVIDLAIFNHAREPDFVRDRNELRDTLEEVANLRRSIQSKYVNRILGQLEKAQEKVDHEARNSEEKSERMAKDFLDGNIRHEDFIDRYINIRKRAIQKRIVADKLVKERSKLDENVTSGGKHKNNKTVDQQNSPTPTPRQRKRLSLVIK